MIKGGAMAPRCIQTKLKKNILALCVTGVVWFWDDALACQLAIQCGTTLDTRRMSSLFIAAAARGSTLKSTTRCPQNNVKKAASPPLPSLTAAGYQYICTVHIHVGITNVCPVYQRLVTRSVLCSRCILNL